MPPVVDRRVLAVAVLGAVFLSITGIGWLGPWAPSPGPFAFGPVLGLAALVPMFAVTEAAVLHVQHRREAQAISLSEIPLVLGLLLADPFTFFAARVLGAATVHVGVRRLPPLKLAFNVALQASEATIALLVHRGISGGAMPGTPRGAAAVCAAAVLTALLTGWALRTVIGLSTGTWSWRSYLTEARQYPPLALGVAAAGLVAVYALQSGGVAWVALAVSLLVALVGYRGYARLRERHLSLETLFEFSRALDAADSTQLPLQVLVGVADIFEAEQVALLSVTPDGVHSLHELVDGAVVSSAVGADDPRRALLAEAARAGGGLLRTLATESAGSLAAAGLRDLLAAPLRTGSGGTSVLLVGDRMGDVRGYDRDDLQLLQMVAHHAGVALENDDLIGRLRHDASHDLLTGRLNRAGWEVLARAALDTAPGGAAGVTAVLLFDLDGFKDVNDTLGHAHGDRLIIEVGERLVDAVAAVPGAVVGRFGGDEFAVLVPGGESGDAVDLAHELVAAMQVPIALGAVEVEVHACVGVSWAPDHGADLQVLLRRADLALAQAKAGADGVSVFHDGLDDQGPNRLALMADLRQALRQGEVVVAVQPKVDVADGSLVGVEALARWRHPVQGPVAPDLFIALAERSGLIVELTTAVLEQTLTACATWREAGLEIPVAVNLSPRALLTPGLLATVAGALERHRLPARLLILEITEGSVIAEPERALRVLHTLRDLGVRLSVDDFGTGYSSLSYLKRLPVQEVKIDRAFVADLAEDEDNAVIVRAVVEIGRSLGLTVVAEGVEDLATWRRLAELGCGAAQGYFFGRPMPTGELLGWLTVHEAGLASRTASGGGALLGIPGPRAATDPEPVERSA